MVLDRDLLTAIGIYIMFSKNVMIVREEAYEGCLAPMVDKSNQKFPYIPDKTVKPEDLFINSYVKKCLKFNNAISSTCRMRRIIDAKYEKSDLNTVMSEKCQYLNAAERYIILTLLRKFKDMSGGTLGTCNATPVDLELKDDVKPVCSQPYTVPRIHEAMSRK